MTRCKNAVQDLVADYEKTINKSIIEKTNLLFDIVSKFIIQNELILYGGFAINLLLPKDKKLYDNTNLSDFDCFSNNARFMAIKLSNIIANKGFKYIEVKPSMHKGTWKVFVEFIPVCDITQLDPLDFEYMYKIAKHESITLQRNTSFIVAPISFLKRELCIELAQPTSSFYRWEKVLKRFYIFMDTFPDKPLHRKMKNIYDGNFPDLNKLLKDVIDIALKNNCVFVGNIAIDLLKDNFNIDHLKVYSPYNAFIELITLDPTHIIECINKNNNLQITIIDDFTIHIHYQDHLIIAIYNATFGCFSYCNKSLYRVGTIFTILYLLYRDYMRRETSFLEDLKYNIKQVITLSKKMKCKDKCFLNTNCYGKVITNLQIRKEAWDKRLLKYRPQTNNINSLFNTELNS